MSSNKENIFILVVVFITASLLILVTINSGDLIGPDIGPHVMTGVMIADLIRDIKLIKTADDIKNYIWHYYAHYSSIGLIHWPPLYYLLEGIFFLIVPFTKISAKIITYIAALLGLFYYYKLVEALYNRHAAFLSSMLLLSTPLFLVYARMPTLEMPSLSLSIMAIYYFYKYNNNNILKYGIISSILTGLALLTKQTSIFLLLFYSFFYIMQIIYDKKLAKLNYYHILSFVNIILIISLPHYLIALYYHAGPTSKDIFQGTVYKNPYLDINNYLHYLLDVRNQFTFIVIIFAIFFIFLSIFRNDNINRASNRFLITWIISCYLFFTILSQKADRYIIYWTPAITAMAAHGFLTLLHLLVRTKKEALQQRSVAGGIWLISLVSLFLGFSIPQPYAQGYAGIAHFLLQHTPKERNEIVFWDGDDYQLMALALREQDNNRRILLWRSSKYLFAHAILSEYELWNIRTNQEDILELFNKYGIRYIILSYETEFEVKGIQSLRELVQDKNKFSLATKFDVKNTWTKEGGGEIRVFYYKEATPLTGETELEIPMPSLGRTIKLNLQLK